MSNSKSARFGKHDWQPRVVQGGIPGQQNGPQGAPARELPAWLRMPTEQQQRHKNVAVEKPIKARKHLRLVTPQKSAPEARASASGSKPKVTKLVSKTKRATSVKKAA